ncbi:MAG: DUF1622 domain-containing protein [Opitutales bacterium]
MNKWIRPLAEIGAALTELIGILVICLFAVYTAGLAVWQLARPREKRVTFHQLRLRLGRGILLGLEFLVAADIIHTVGVKLNYQTLGVLAIVVLIRTFLSFTLEAELNGRWPWQQPEEGKG